MRSESTEENCMASKAGETDKSLVLGVDDMRPFKKDRFLNRRPGERPRKAPKRETIVVAIGL